MPQPQSKYTIPCKTSQKAVQRTAGEAMRGHRIIFWNHPRPSTHVTPSLGSDHDLLFNNEFRENSALKQVILRYHTHFCFGRRPMDQLLLSTSRTPLYCRYLINHSTDSLKASSFAAFTVGLFCTSGCRMTLNELLGRRMKIYHNAPDRREWRTHEIHPRSRSGDIRAQSLRISYLLLHTWTWGTIHHPRRYLSGEGPCSSLRKSAIQYSAGIRRCL